MSPAPKPRKPRLGLHLATWLTLAMMVYAIVFCQFVPWQRFEMIGCIIYSKYDFGWPSSFVRERPRQRWGQSRDEERIQFSLAELQSNTLLCAWRRPWPWEYASMQVDHFALALDSIIWLGILASGSTIVELRLRMDTKRLQVSLRGLLLLTAAIATVLSVLPAVGFQLWLDPNKIHDQYFAVSFDDGWCVWTPECTLVALLLCVGLTCALYSAGMLLVRIVCCVTGVVTSRFRKSPTCRIP